MHPRTRSPVAGSAGLWAILFLTGACCAVAQGTPIVIEDVESIDFDRPEAWAMKYFTSLSLMSGLGAPTPLEPGAVELALEGGLVPTLGEDKRRVGFVGNKVEDLNRTSVFGRARVTVGLARRLALTIGVTPPLEIDGVTPEILALALAKPVHQSRHWRLAVRLNAQLGSIEGDLTCPSAVAGSRDPERNPDACLEPSDDEMSHRALGLELTAARRLAEDRWQPYAALSVQHLDLEFQVDARLEGFDDRTRLESDGVTWSAALGTVLRSAAGWRLAGELFYTPLDVVRDPLRGAQNDELVSGRVLATWAWR